MPCQTNMWVCGLKTKLARAVSSGDIDMSAANSLLAKYGEHPLIGNAVYRGALPKDKAEKLQQYLLRPLP